MSLATARNILIVLAIAALVAIVPGGGTAAAVAGQAAGLVFLALIAWLGTIQYRQHRSTLYGLGDRRRAILYVAAGVAMLTLTATSRLWATGLGSVVWLALIAGAAYAVFAVFWAARKY